MSEALALEVRNITKRFPGVLANDRVNFTLKRVKSTPCWVKMARGSRP